MLPEMRYLAKKITAVGEPQTFGIEVASDTKDVCKDMGVKCPVKPGDSWQGSLLYPVPHFSAFPGVKVTLVVQVKDGEPRVRERVLVTRGGWC